MVNKQVSYSAPPACRPRCKRGSKPLWRGCTRCAPVHESSLASSTKSTLDEVSASKPLCEIELELGCLSIAYMEPEDIKAASLMMGRSFCDVGALSITEIRDFLEMTLTEWPDAAAYIARLYPREGSDVFVPEGKDHRVAGIVLLSFTSETRDSFLALNELPVPANSVYLANMAVDKAFRRLGVARRLMDVCIEESSGSHAQRECVCLHVNEDNAAAIGLYQQAGFSVHMRPPNRSPLGMFKQDEDPRNIVMVYPL